MGTSGLLLITATADIQNIKSFDVVYNGMVVSNFLAGINISLFPILSNALDWFPAERAGEVQSIYGGIGGSALGLSLLFLNYMLE